jgi:hypothetical protein
MEEPDIVTQPGEYRIRDGRKAHVLEIRSNSDFCVLGKLQTKPGGRMGGTYYWDLKDHYINARINKLDIVSAWGQGGMQYHIYLLGPGDHSQAGGSFIADDNSEAREIAIAVFGSCYTSFQGIELWTGTTLVMRKVHIRATVDLQKVIDKRQENIAQLEEVLEQSFECIRKSRQLMDALDKVRTARG